MGFFSSSKDKDELVLVFDIGSSSVGGAFFRLQENGIPKIIFTVREPIILEENIDVDRFLALTVQSLGVLTEKMFKSAVGAPSRIFCILSSPWYVSQTRIINLTKEVPFIFTSNLADELIQKEIAIFEKENLAKYTEEGQKIRSIELKNIRTMLNGYETSNPLNQQANELEMTMFFSVSPEKVLATFEEIIKKYFHFNNIKFSSFAMASFAVLRDMYKNQENFLLTDIRGEITDIAMVKKNILRESISFPFGYNFIIRGMASVLNCTLAEAESFISLLKDGHMETDTERKVKPALEQLKNDWLQKFQENLASLSKDISIPSVIYLSVDKDFMSFFGEIIEHEQFNQYTLTDSKFKINFLNTEALHGIATFENNTLRDPFIIIDSVYINRFSAKI